MPSVDEILQIILNELDDPSAFSLISKRYYTFTQDPYVRALYFLSRYGPIQAMYWALGRGRLMNEKVIDVRSVLFLGASYNLLKTSFESRFSYRLAPTSPDTSSSAPCTIITARRRFHLSRRLGSAP